ncbi:MAG: ATP-binding cassette domain-containing protein [Anaerolineae bacterium]|nr:ATP-binding cassette domain-containing protein [Anaerolineae bacterium]
MPCSAWTVRRFYGPDGKHAPRGARIDDGEAARRVRHWLARLGIDALAGKYPAQLSGGQRQRAAIARTLAMQPDLLLMDEPFSALDVATREDLQTLTLELRREAALTSVIVTHNIEEAVYLGEKILALRLPPNSAACVIDNPSAGAPDYAKRAAFQAKCDELRAALGVMA